MNESNEQFARLLGQAALILWPDLPRVVQERLFETAVPTDEVVRNNLAVFLHQRHPRHIPVSRQCWLNKILLLKK